MNHLMTGAGVLLAGLLAVTQEPRQQPTQADKPAVVVGTFDSRGVLIAYVRSQAFQTYLEKQKKDIGAALARAKSAADAELAASLADLGPAMQRRIHEQGFGTAPVDGILARIEQQFPAIAKKAGVDVIVSKWKLTWQSPSAKFVDVTELLAAEFEPDEKTWKTIRQIVQKDPVPREELRNHK